MVKHSGLKFSQTRDRLIYTVSLSLNSNRLSIEDELFLASFHRHGELGSKIFDLFNRYLYASSHLCKRNIEVLYGQVYDFCQDNDEYEVALIMNDVFFYNYEIKSAEVCTVILHFINMLDCFYGDGIVDYIDHKAKKVVRTQLFPGSIATTCDLSAYCILRAYYETGVQLGSIALSKENVTKLIESKSNYTLAGITLGSSFVDALQSEKNRSEIQKHALNTCSNGFVVGCSGHYKTTPSTSISFQFATCLWDRENFSGNSSEALITRLLIDYCKSDVLKNRTVLLREKGVVIKRRNGEPLFDTVQSVCMREDHCVDKNIHNIVMNMSMDNEYKTRELVLDIRNTHSSKVNLLFGIDIPCVGLLQVVLGINTMDKYDLGAVKELFKTDKEYEDFVELAKDGVSKLNTMFNLDDLVFEEPTSWNDYNKSGRRYGARNGEILYSIIETIGMYTRNLPVGSMPSENAIKLAKDHCMNLPDGKTFVSEFTRKRDVRAKERYSPLSKLLNAGNAIDV